MFCARDYRSPRAHRVQQSLEPPKDTTGVLPPPVADMPSLVSSDAPLSQAKYVQLAQEEGAKRLAVEAPPGPLGSGAPPVMRTPACWAAVLVLALSASVMLSGPAAPPVVVENALEVSELPGSSSTYAVPALRGAEDSTLTALIAENSILRADLASKSSSGSGGASDEAFSGRIGASYRINPQLSVFANLSSSFSPNVGVVYDDVTSDESRPAEPTRALQKEIGVKREST